MAQQANSSTATEQVTMQLPPRAGVLPTLIFALHGAKPWMLLSILDATCCALHGTSSYADADFQQSSKKMCAWEKRLQCCKCGRIFVYFVNIACQFWGCLRATTWTLRVVRPASGLMGQNPFYAPSLLMHSKVLTHHGLPTMFPACLHA
eukprot:439039-Pelagomonas_calceolata.AAC.3